MSTSTAACTRCGIRRAVKPERGVPDLCLDCRQVEADVERLPNREAKHGTEAGYFAHIKRRHDWPRTACIPCLDAHREAEGVRNRKRGVRPRAEAMRAAHDERRQSRTPDGRWATRDDAA